MHFVYITLKFKLKVFTVDTISLYCIIVVHIIKIVWQKNQI